MFKTRLFKHIVVCLFWAGSTLLHAQSFQATMVSQGTTLIVKVKPTGGNVTTGFANMEFYMRYPNTKTITWGNPTVNSTDFSGIAIEKNDPYTSVTQAGYTIVRFFLPPGTFVGSKTYTRDVEYEVFRTTATGLSSTALEMVHQDSENPYVLTIVNEGASSELTGTTKFYGIGASIGGAVQTLPLTVVLPLELLNFTGRAENTVNKLSWGTANEVNTSHCVVEKAVGNSNKFVAIGEVKTSNVSSSTPQYYNFTDPQPSSLDYYRLKMVDRDGQFTYSKTIALTRKSDVKIDLYPNPATNTLNIALDNKFQTATVTISDATGRILATQSKNKDKSDNGLFVFDTQHFANGVYSVAITVDGKQSLHKVVVTK